MTRIGRIDADFFGGIRMTLQHEAITDDIINAFYHVYNTLGYGFLEKVYENALTCELRKRGHLISQQTPLIVRYDDVVVGEYFADMLVDDVVILELKADKAISAQHEAQLLNYLKATRIEVGLVLNFGPKPAFSRKVFSQTNPRSSA